MITVYGNKTKEYLKLNTFASILNQMTDSTVGYIVQDTYFDFGQDWMWTTIIKIDRTTNSTCQILSPKLHEDILTNDSIDKMYELASEYLN